MQIIYYYFFLDGRSIHSLIKLSLIEITRDVISISKFRYNCFYCKKLYELTVKLIANVGTLPPRGSCSNENLLLCLFK